MKQSKIFLLMLFVFINGFSQNKKIIYGQLTSKEQVPTAVKIVNLKTEREAISDSNGKFVIIVELGDLLVFSSENYEYERKIIEENDFKSATVNVNLTQKAEVLDEVVINTSKINAVSLGILSQPAVQFTPAERRLRAAGAFEPYALVGNFAGFGLSFDPVINAITGRTKKLKKELKVEQKEIIVKKLESLFTEDYYHKKLKVKIENIKGFQYFCAENENFRTIFKTNNKTKISFKITELAFAFNKIQSNETK